MRRAVVREREVVLRVRMWSHSLCPLPRRLRQSRGALHLESAAVNEIDLP
jgi:hypothetical protein